MRERWEVVPGCERYEVSSLGRVRRVGGRGVAVRENRAGWQVVELRGRTRSVVDTKRVFQVHRLVAQVFLAITEPVGHRDGDHRNNAARNLVACASEREAKRMSGRLRYRRGSANGQAKLKARQVRRMRELRAKGWTLASLGERYSVSHQLASRICQRKAWKEVAR